MLPRSRLGTLKPLRLLTAATHALPILWNQLYM
jgi:hypothetical protein